MNLICQNFLHMTSLNYIILCLRQNINFNQKYLANLFSLMIDSFNIKVGILLKFLEQVPYLSVLLLVVITGIKHFELSKSLTCPSI